VSIGIGGAGYHWSTTGVCNRRKDMQANVGQIKRKYAGNRWSTKNKLCRESLVDFWCMYKRVGLCTNHCLITCVCINEMDCAEIIVCLLVSVCNRQLGVGNPKSTTGVHV